jgi:hypothetical protein
MSKKCRQRASFRGSGKRSGHSHETKENRMRIGEGVSDFLWSIGRERASPAELELEDVRLYVQVRLALGISPRALHNEVSAMRAMIKVCGRRDFAASPELRSRALGIPRGSRIGTNSPISDAACEDLIERAEAIDPGTACLIRLERTIGLRGKEGNMSPPSLAPWMEQLLTGQPLHVTRGTKGGRERHVNVPCRSSAQHAIELAIAFCAQNDGVFYPHKTLKQALRRYEHVMGHRLKVKGHSLRYRFAEDRYRLYRADGLTEDEALVFLARDLGHGDKRGRWVRQVYLRNLLPPLKGRRSRSIPTCH